MKGERLVLLVDEEPEFCSNFQKCLRDLNCEVVVASSREEACRVALDYNLNMVVLGNIMPRGEAFKLHWWFKNHPSLSEIPHVILDASPENHLTRGWRRDEGLRIDAVEYFCKPVKPDYLANSIEKLLEDAAEGIKVLIADDHTMVREGIRTLLNLQKDIYIVGEATNGSEAFNKSRELQPDVVLMDIVMPELNGIEATRRICSECRERVKVLMLSQYDDEQNFSASKEAGALGFVSKKGAGTQLLEAVRAASRGEFPGQGQRYVS